MHFLRTMAVETIRANAWAGKVAAASDLDDGWPTWTLKRRQTAPPPAMDATDLDLREWKNPKVGWGLLLPDLEDPTIKDSERARANNADLQRLVEFREGVVLRHRPKLMPGKLRRYYDLEAHQDLNIGQDRGVGVGELPFYILIAASPEVIPWEDQYVLAGRHAVGRIDLAGDALKNYVDHVINDWKDCKSNANSPLIWTVDLKDGITTLMRDVIARPIYDRYHADSAFRTTLLDDKRATRDELKKALKDNAPAMVITISHGRTEPLDNIAELRKTLGVPVDLGLESLDPDFLKGWNPNGAIWYAHACCSAGSNRKSDYLGLFPKDEGLTRILTSVAALGSTIAPLPTALLGAEKPARAFIGHVEPTFDWPLLDPEVRQPLASAFVRALYDRLYNGKRYPVGYAFDDVQREAGASYQAWKRALDKANSARKVAEQKRFQLAALRSQLTGLDREGVVILGDPAVVLPQTLPLS